MFNPHQILDRRPALFSVVVMCIMGILAGPVIAPHMFHGFHIAHIMLHVGGIVLAVFLAVLGIKAYFRARTKRMCLTSAGFLMFVAAETVTLVDITWPFVYRLGSISLLETSHLLLLAAFGLIAMGVFRDD